jgi:hypothetical protein
VNGNNQFEQRATNYLVITQYLGQFSESAKSKEIQKYVENILHRRSNTFKLIEGTENLFSVGKSILHFIFIFRREWGILENN